MDDQTAKRYADTIRQQSDQATAALNMSDHITGAYWVSAWCAIDLAEKIQEGGGPLKMYDGTTYSMTDALQSMQKALEGMRSDIDTLKKALQQQQNP